MANLILLSVKRDSQNDPKLSCEKEDTETAVPRGVTSCISNTGREPETWIVGYISTPAGLIPSVSSEWTKKEHWQHIKCRISSYQKQI